MMNLRKNLLPKLNEMISQRASVNLARLATDAKQEEKQPLSYEEVRIPVPWGHIAGKWWGPQNKRPILVLHGWQDNCGSFDRLIPLLPREVGYLAIDLPGHGLSSQLAPGSFYFFMDCPIILRQIQEYFKWPKLTLMGHSSGAVACYIFAAMFSDSIDFVICLDGTSPYISTNHVDTLKNAIEDFVQFDFINSAGDEPPSHTYEELELIMHKNYGESIALENCKYILQRNIKPSKYEGKYFFSRDIRLKCSNFVSWTEEDDNDALEKIDFPLLVTASKFLLEFQGITFEELVHKFHNKSDIEIHELNGTHHIHLNEPEKVAEILYPFIKKYCKEEQIDIDKSIIASKL